MSSPPQLSCIEISTGQTVQASVIWLHGLGASGHDFEPIVPELNLPDIPAVRFIFPHAPIRPVTVNGGFEMRAWYDIAEQTIDRDIDHTGIRETSGLVQQLIDREIDRGIAASSIILAGFSQGAVIALEVGLRFQPRLAGIIALSTYLADRNRVPAGNMPIFMGHGSMDPVVPVGLGQSARVALEKSGHTVEWHQYTMEHSVCMEEISAIGNWITARFKRLSD